jgi:hypothetical protein
VIAAEAVRVRPCYFFGSSALDCADTNSGTASQASAASGDLYQRFIQWPLTILHWNHRARGAGPPPGCQGLARSNTGQMLVKTRAASESPGFEPGRAVALAATLPAAPWARWGSGPIRATAPDGHRAEPPSSARNRNRAVVCQRPDPSQPFPHPAAPLLGGPVDHGRLPRSHHAVITDVVITDVVITDVVIMDASRVRLAADPARSRCSRGPRAPAGPVLRRRRPHARPFIRSAAARRF